MPEKNPVQSAERIFEILETLVKNGAMGLTELSAGLGLHKSTVHRLLNSLAVMGYVRQDPATGKYLSTFKIVELAGRLLGRIDILSVAHRHLEELMKQTHETVHFVQREGCNIVYIDKVESDANSIRMVSHIGLLQPMFCTAVGKAILAELPDEEIRSVWGHSGVHKLTPNTIVDFDGLMREIEKIRRDGYALDNEENEVGVRCIAASVLNFSGKTDNAFSISAPLSRMSDGRVRELSAHVLATKRAISRELGYRDAL